LYNPDDLSFLLSRQLDGDLGPQERARLEEALRSSPQLRREAEQLRGIHALLERWAVRAAEPDAVAIEGLTLAQINGELRDAELAKVDSLLQRWAARAGPAVPDLRAQVLEAIQANRRPAARRLLFRLGAPLAAAAALAIALVGPWFTPRESIYVAIGQTSVTRAVEPEVVVSFAPPLDSPEPDSGKTISMGFMTIETVITDEGSSL
jgi:anti-sigma factor RsiW